MPPKREELADDVLNIRALDPEFLRAFLGAAVGSDLAPVNLMALWSGEMRAEVDAAEYDSLLEEKLVDMLSYFEKERALVVALHAGAMAMRELLEHHNGDAMGPEIRAAYERLTGREENGGIVRIIPDRDELVVVAREDLKAFTLVDGEMLGVRCVPYVDPEKKRPPTAQSMWFERALLIAPLRIIARAYQRRNPASDAESWARTSLKNKRKKFRARAGL